MNFDWATSEVSKNAVTIYQNNITLNKQASSHFEDVSYVLLGFDKEENKLGIKPVYHDDINKQIYPKEQLHRVSIGASYARIANKSFIEQISSNLNINFDDKTSYKFIADFDIIHQILLVNLEEEKS